MVSLLFNPILFCTNGTFLDGIVDILCNIDGIFKVLAKRDIRDIYSKMHRDLNKHQYVIYPLPGNIVNNRLNPTLLEDPTTHKYYAGHDLPVWLNDPKKAEHRILIISQDPRRNKNEMLDKNIGNKKEIGISTPFGLHSEKWRSAKSRGLIHWVAEELIKEYKDTVSIYYTDVYKFRGADGKQLGLESVLDERNYKPFYEDVIKREIDIFDPTVILLMGGKAQEAYYKVFPKTDKVIETDHPSPQNRRWNAKSDDKINYINILLKNKLGEPHMRKKINLGLGKKAKDLFDKISEESTDNLGSDQLKNNIRRLVDEWIGSGDQWIKDYLKKMNPLDTYPHNKEIESKSDIQSLLRKVLKDCHERMNEEDIHSAIETIKDICYATNYPSLDKGERFCYGKSQHKFNIIEKNLIKKIGEMQVFKEDKIAEAVQVSIEDQPLSDEPLGCYARPGMIKVNHNSREIKYPTIVLYLKEIEDLAKKHNLKREEVTAFVYLYQLCRVYFDRYPYANLLKFKDSVTRDDSLSSIERPIVAMAALDFANNLSKDVLYAGEIIINDEDLYRKWSVMHNWQQDGLNLYNNKQTSLIDKYRKVAFFLSDPIEKEKRFSFLDEYMKLLND